MLDIFAFDFMRKAMVAVVVLSMGMAPVGCFLVLRRLSLAGEATRVRPGGHDQNPRGRRCQRAVLCQE